MKSYIKIFVAVFIIAILAAGCKKFLDVKPRGIVIPQKTEDYELLLNSEQLLRTFPSTIMFMTDGITDISSKADNTPVAYAYFWNKELDYDTKSSSAIWSSMYNSIYTTNAIIGDVLNAAGENQAKKQAIWAEAQVFKSQFLFDLLTVFAKAYNPATAAKDPGIPLVTSIDMEDVTPPRSSVKECFDAIIKNVTDAIPLLPEININNARVNKKAANAFLSRVYLYMGEYEKSKQYADEVLKSNPQLMDFNTIPNYFGMYYMYPGPEENKEILWHRQTEIATFSMRPYINDDFIALYDMVDLRKPVFIFNNPYTQKNTFGVTRTSFGIFLSEVMYNKAEALARANDGAGAMKIVNTIREKRFMTGTYAPLSAANPQEALRIVLEERRKDLLFAGNRWFDMKRLNAKGEMPDVKRLNPTTGEVLATLKAGSPYTFEIPKRVQMFNPSMPKNF